MWSVRGEQVRGVGVVKGEVWSVREVQMQMVRGEQMCSVKRMEGEVWEVMIPQLSDECPPKSQHM